MVTQSILFSEHDRIRIYDNGVFRDPKANECKYLYNGAVVPLSLLQTHTLKLAGKLSEEELRVQIEIRMFEEGNLNTDEEYTIDFVRHPVVAEDAILAEVFALSHLKAQQYYTETLSKTAQTIDRIIPSFLAYESFYTAPVETNDLFIYWGEEEAYAAIYQRGHYIAHRSIETLTTIAVETGFELPKLRQILRTKGIVEENFTPEELNLFIRLQERIAKNVERIVHTLNHKRGLFSLSGIDNLYLDMEGSPLNGLEALFSAYGVPMSAPIPMTFEGVEPKEIHDVLCARALSAPQENSFNLSPFPRKAPWYKRDSGKFLAIAGGTLLSVLAASVVLFWMSSSYEERNEELSAQLNTLRTQTAAMSTTLKTERARLGQEKKHAAQLQEEISLYHSAEDTAALMVQMHEQRHRFLSDTVQSMGRYRMGAVELDQNGSKQLSIHVVADDRKRDTIAKLMESLYALGYQNVETKEIFRDANSTSYHSLIKVTR